MSVQTGQTKTSKTTQKEDTMTQSIATQQGSEQAADKSAIRPFRVNVPEAELTELRKRIIATRWPERETVRGRHAGRAARDDSEARPLLGDGVRLAQGRGETELLPALHHRNRWAGHPFHPCAIEARECPAAHRQPRLAGSVIEQLKIIEPLTDPTAHGGSAADAFHLVIPSMPGYGFSGKPTTAGWGPERIARAWATLMERLGYQRYAAQGGDWGALIVDLMGVQAPPGLIGIHTNMAGAIPPEVDAAAFAGAAPPAGLDEEEKYSFDHVSFFYKHGLGYALEMGNRPQTLYGIEDSPVGLAAWIIDHDIWTYRQIARVFDGAAEGLTRDDILDNITLYWLTKTGVSSARLYWENKFAFFAPKGVTIPVVVSAFPEEICPIPRKWAEKAYPKLVYYKRHPKGAHFAAWEQPQALVEDLRAGFKSLR